MFVCVCWRHLENCVNNINNITYLLSVGILLFCVINIIIQQQLTKEKPINIGLVITYLKNTKWHTSNNNTVKDPTK